jgi:hypothetical protein
MEMEAWPVVNSILTLLFTAMVAGATVVYARLTASLVAETKKMREAQTEPNVSVHVQTSEVSINLVEMVIRNVGLGTAYDVRFTVEPDFDYISGTPLSGMGFIKHGIPYLARDQQLKFLLTSILETGLETRFEVVTTFSNAFGKKYERRYLIDFSVFAGFHEITRDSPLKDIAKGVKDIARGLNNVQHWPYSIRVKAFSPVEAEEESAKFLAEMRVRDAAVTAEEVSVPDTGEVGTIDEKQGPHDGDSQASAAATAPPRARRARPGGLDRENPQHESLPPGSPPPRPTWAERRSIVVA